MPEQLRKRDATGGPRENASAFNLRCNRHSVQRIVRIRPIAVVARQEVLDVRCWRVLPTLQNSRVDTNDRAGVKALPKCRSARRHTLAVLGLGRHRLILHHVGVHWIDLVNVLGPCVCMEEVFGSGLPPLPLFVIRMNVPTTNFAHMFCQ